MKSKEFTNKSYLKSNRGVRCDVQWPYFLDKWQESMSYHLKMCYLKKTKNPLILLKQTL